MQKSPRGAFGVKRLIMAAAVSVGLGAAGSASAQIVGFGGTATVGSQNSTWTLNGLAASTSEGVPAVTGSGSLADVLNITTANGSEASSAWYDTPENITNFTESFTYTDTSTSGADGLGVVWQNVGVNALGSDGGKMGFSNLTTTAGLAMNLYSGNTTSSTGYSANIPGSNNPLVVPTPGGNLTNTSLNRVNIDSGDPINVDLSYVDSAGTLSETMTDATNGNTFTRVWRGISIASAVGGSTAYVGLTGGTGGVSAAQSVTNFQFTPGAAVPSPATITPIAATGYNQNMVISSTAGTVNMTATMDQGTGNTLNAFFEVGTDSAAPVLGVPKAGVVFGSETDPNHSFIMQPNGPGQDDAIMLDGTHTTGALTFTGSSSYSLLSLLVSGANGGGAVNLVINYANGGTQTTSITAPDWFSTDGASPDQIAWYGNGRASVADAATDTFTFNDINNQPSQQPVMMEEDVALTDTTDAVTSVDLTYSGTNRVVIWGISGTATAAVPEPTSLGLVCIGAAGLLIRRRRSSKLA